MKIEKFVTGIISTNCYLVINEETKQTVVIDPAACPSYLMGHMKSEGLQVEAILLTHGHFDHIMGIDDLRREFPVPVYVHEGDRETLLDPALNLSSSYTNGYTFDGADYIRDGQRLELAGFSFQVIHTPGHTPGGVCYYLESEGVLFSGDTLFQNSVGRTDFPNSSMSDLIRSLREKVMKLPDDVKVYPGHMGETTIGHERKYNPFI
ncbi:MBL fold metallo-hydrolase [Faecalicatena contorta]|uniref:MBL fold metallo-hydrolase n=1 Tax=Faecalicatena fissicatena TaxID=290055 RepID=A0ABS2E8Z4_9FIRM|nr:MULTISPECIES: MBL fold metallo-hydrolase [Clostridia]MBM6685102.1 MBL fold metallo-hydrolase [Faecalicatena contorta]MBM6710630.1 MBL fold metallo-hydrolase [Faecalicatena contorta]MBM6738047.1 MBL fold metallo-hydrolase [Faecalicatena fissicatena]HIX98632.1 MBL fold metallo-hydrolase [Candidatus Dorea intestinigallinarum]